MRVVILTSIEQGLASLALDQLAATPGLEVVEVVLAKQAVAKGWKKLRRQFLKTRRIGLLGALVALRMRSWYDEETMAHLNPQPLIRECQRLGIPLTVTPTTNSEETKARFRAIQADVGLSLGNSYISPAVFGIPRLGMVNSHHEVLPDFQGARSVIWQVHEGSVGTGYTIHEIDRQIDTGRILLLKKMPIEFQASLRETVSWNYARLLSDSVVGLAQVLTDFEATRSQSRPQGAGRSFTSPSYQQYQWMLHQHEMLSRSVRLASGKL